MTGLGFDLGLLASGVTAANVLALGVVQSVGCSTREACERPDWRNGGGRLRESVGQAGCQQGEFILEEIDEKRHLCAWAKEQKVYHKGMLVQAPWRTI